jgi:creatinine amidohydrolase
LSFLLSADEIDKLDNIAVLPVGSLEQHGRHLPVNTDNILAQEFAGRIGARLDAFVLPCIPISTAYEHKGKKGSVWMSADTFYHMLLDIICNLKDQGFDRVVVIKGHGGIFVMDPLIRHINSVYSPELRVCMLNPYFPEALAGILESDCHIHADEMETSLMLYLRPELVKMELAVDFVPDVPQHYLQYGSIFNYSPGGVWGKPSLASAEKGRLCLEIGVEKSITFINDVFEMMENRKY